MADNASLGAAKTAKNDEFYTQYSDIEAEMNAYVEYNPDVFRGKTILLPCDDPEWSQFTRYFASNFERFGLKKLISTSYAKGAGNRQLTLFEAESPLYDEEKHDTHGKLFVLTRDADGSGNIDMDDVEFTGYLEGDGDFRSAEVCKLRDEADIIVTNPPFSQFTSKKGKIGFLAWIMEANKQFIIMGNKNSVTHREVFPLIKENKIWIGYRNMNKDFWLRVPEGYEYEKLDDDGTPIKHINACWYTNIEHGRRHEPLPLDTLAHNLKFNKPLLKRLKKDYGVSEYPYFDNYRALEVPIVEAIPSDYDGVMGVPRTFLGSYNPDQFEIIGRDADIDWAENECDFFTPPDKEIQDAYKKMDKTWRVQIAYIAKDGVPKNIFARVFIRPKKKGADAQ